MIHTKTVLRTLLFLSTLLFTLLSSSCHSSLKQAPSGLPEITKEEKTTIEEHIKKISYNSSSSELTEIYTSAEAVYNLAAKEYSQGKAVGELLARHGYHIGKTKKEKLIFLYIRALNSFANLDSNITQYMEASYRVSKEQFKNPGVYNVAETLLDNVGSPQWPSCYWVIGNLDSTDAEQEKIIAFRDALYDYYILKNETADSSSQFIEKDFRDIAVRELKMRYKATHLISMEFSNEERDIIAYGLQKDSTDGVLTLFKSLLMPLSQNDDTNQFRSKYPLFEEESGIFRFDYTENRPALTKEEKLNRIDMMKQAFSLDSTLGASQLLIGHLYDSIGYQDSALVAYEKLATVPPFNKVGGHEWENVESNKLSLLGDLNRHEDVIKLYELMATHIPDYHTNRVNSVIPMAYLGLEQPEKAYSYYYDSCTIDSSFLNKDSGMKLDWAWGTRLSWVALLAQKYDKVKEIETHYDNQQLEYFFHFTLMSGNSPDSLDTDSCDYALSMMNVGHAYLCENNTEIAVSYYNRSLDILKRHNSKDEEKTRNDFKNWMSGDFKTFKKFNLPLNDLPKIEALFNL